MKTCGNCQWQHNGNCRRSTWGVIEQVVSTESNYNVSAWWGYVGKDDPACPAWTGEDTTPDSDGLTAVYMHAHRVGGDAMRERVKQLEKAAENDVFIIQRQTERIEGLKAELQAAYDLLEKENRNHE